jgi:exosortase H (IPTLxxWG-CTERM-specific)
LAEKSGFKKMADVLRREPVRFAVVFVIIVAAVFTLHGLIEDTRFMDRYIEIIAASVGLVLRVIPGETIVRGSLVRFHEFAVRIVPECSGAEAMAIFCAAVIAFPATIKQKVQAIVVGIPTLYVVNVLRLACLAAIGAFTKNKEVFQFAHVYVWQTIFIVFVVILWLIWIEKVVKRQAPQRGEQGEES